MELLLEDAASKHRTIDGAEQQLGWWLLLVCCTWLWLAKVHLLPSAGGVDAGDVGWRRLLLGYLLHRGDHAGDQGG